jgi:hypothetical protein
MTLSEIVRDIVRTGRLYFTTGQKIQVDNILKYSGSPTFTDPNDIPNVAFVNGVAISPFYFSFLSTDPYPVVIGGATAILAPFVGSAAPGVSVRELGSVVKYRNNDCVVYDPTADTLTIDLGTNLDGDITIFKP